MKSSVEPLEGNKVKLTVSIDESEFDRDIDQAFRKIAHEVRLPGFRDGKVPRRVLEARIGLAPAREQALRDAIPEYLAKAVREHDVDLIATPEVEITERRGRRPGGLRRDAPGASRDHRARLRRPARRAAVAGRHRRRDRRGGEAELRRHGELVDVDRPSAAGDFITIDLVATRDGEEVAGLNTEDWSYEVGQGWIADDFDDQVTGVLPGVERRFTAVPKGTDEPADFVVTVSRVQELVLPEPTDEWVGENLGDHDTVDEWRASIRERISSTKLGQARSQLVDKVTDGSDRAHRHRAARAARAGRPAAPGRGHRAAAAVAGHHAWTSGCPPPGRTPRSSSRA